MFLETLEQGEIQSGKNCETLSSVFFFFLFSSSLMFLQHSSSLLLASMAESKCLFLFWSFLFETIFSIPKKFVFMGNVHVLQGITIHTAYNLLFYFIFIILLFAVLKCRGESVAP